MISSESISKELKQAISSLKLDKAPANIGEILEVGDGIALVSGLSEAMIGEQVLFPHGITGIVLNLNEDHVGCAVLGSAENLQEGDEVKTTGTVLSVPVGSPLIGRIVDPLGEPLDGKGKVKTKVYRAVEVKAPGIIDRKEVNRPLQTGIKAIDSMIPIGRGQRELIIGDRQTGKTAIAIDTIINQKGQDMICVYVAIGQKDSTIARIVSHLEESGAMEYTIIVNASASTSSSLQFIAPYAGCTMAEHFALEGKDVLVIYDDLSKHAVAYRQLSLLLKRPPGREAYPGDIFYLHSRLLERAAQLSNALGGGSISALPIVETQGGDVSAYIPTNIISITDGQIYLESDLFYAGVRPAVNAGLSVSRVGGKAQIKAMRKVAGKLRLDLAQYREMEAFSQIGSDLDAATRKQLERGKRLTEVLKQAQYAPLTAEKQVVIIFAVNEGYLDAISVEKISEFEAALLRELANNQPNVLKEIREKKEITTITEATLRKAILEISESFIVVNS